MRQSSHTEIIKREEPSLERHLVLPVARQDLDRSPLLPLLVVARLILRRLIKEIIFIKGRSPRRLLLRHRPVLLLRVALLLLRIALLGVALLLLRLDVSVLRVGVIDGDRGREAPPGCLPGVLQGAALVLELAADLAAGHEHWVDRTEPAGPGHLASTRSAIVGGLGADNNVVVMSVTAAAGCGADGTSDETEDKACHS